jgi:hypothetical protein
VEGCDCQSSALPPAFGRRHQPPVGQNARNINPPRFSRPRSTVICGHGRVASSRRSSDGQSSPRCRPRHPPPLEGKDIAERVQIVGLLVLEPSRGSGETQSRLWLRQPSAHRSSINSLRYESGKGLRANPSTLEELDPVTVWGEAIVEFSAWPQSWEATACHKAASSRKLRGSARRGLDYQ